MAAAKLITAMTVARVWPRTTAAAAIPLSRPLAWPRGHDGHDGHDGHGHTSTPPLEQLDRHR